MGGGGGGGGGVTVTLDLYYPYFKLRLAICWDYESLQCSFEILKLISQVKSPTLPPSLIV